MAYQPALDGLRGLAVLAVLAYHAGQPWARGGFLGVDAFFVLSGYLITALLLAEWRVCGSIDVMNFWVRRTRRLLPALFLMLAGVIVYGAFVAEPEELARLRGDFLANLVYVANWRSVFSGESYFAQFSTPSPLLHTWSLSIEAQWYVFWPLLLSGVLFVRRGGPALAIAMTLSLAIASALLMALLHNPHGDPSRIYYGTDTRAQALLLGAALAAMLAARPDFRPGRFGVIALQAAAIVCAAGVAWVWTTSGYDNVLLYRGGFFALGMGVACVIAATVLSRDAPVARALSFPPLVALGVVSYGLYLWHWPLYLVLTPDRVGFDGHALFAVRLVATLFVSVASYYLVEQPFRRGRGIIARRGSWILAPGAVAVLAVAVLVVARDARNTTLVASSPAPPPAVTAQAGATQPARVLVVGDSVAFTMGQGLGRQANDSNLAVWNQGKIGCGVLRADDVLVDGQWTHQAAACNDWPSTWQSYVDVFEPDAVLLLAGAWDLYDRKVDGRLLAFGSPEADRYAIDEFSSAIDVLSSNGATVMLLTTPDYAQRDLGIISAAPRFGVDRIHRLNALYEDVAENAKPRARVVDLNAFVRNLTADGGEMQEDDVFSDGVHFTQRGADAVAAWLTPMLREAAQPRVRVTAATGAYAGSAPAPRWVEMLAAMPDTEEARTWTVMNDYARFRALFGVAAPDAGSDDAALLAYYRSLKFDSAGGSTALVPSLLSGMQSYPPRLRETEAALGIATGQLELDARTGDGTMQLLRGRFDAITTRATVTDGLHAARDGHVYTASDVTRLESMLATADGAPSLATRSDFAALASALERAGTYTAMFSTDITPYTLDAVAATVAGPDATPNDVLAARSDLDRQPKLRPYAAFAAGAGVDERGGYTTLVLLHDTGEQATGNARLLPERVRVARSWLAQRPFSEIISDIDVVTEGPLLIATLRTSSPGLWFGLHAARDTLLLHE